MIKEEQGCVNKCISEFKNPTRCTHCLKGAFTKDDELSGLKSHNRHRFLEFILLPDIKDGLNNDIRVTIYKIGVVVCWISRKKIR